MLAKVEANLERYADIARVTMGKGWGGAFTIFAVPELLAYRDESNPLWPNSMWLKNPEDLHQDQLQDHQNHPQDHQNRLQGLQNLTNKQPPLGGAPYM